jgi:hypothetical protein
VHVTTEAVSSNPTHGEVYSIQHYVIKFVSDLDRSVVFCRLFMLREYCNVRWFVFQNTSCIPAPMTEQLDLHSLLMIMSPTCVNIKMGCSYLYWSLISVSWRECSWCFEKQTISHCNILSAWKAYPLIILSRQHHAQSHYAVIAGPFLYFRTLINYLLIHNNQNTKDSRGSSWLG